MNAHERARFIMDKVATYPPHAGAIPLTGLFERGEHDRIVYDPAGRWIARFAPDYLRHPSGRDSSGRLTDDRPWGLFQLFAYRQLRVTAHHRDSDLSVTIYKPGPWETMFTTSLLADIDPIVT